MNENALSHLTLQQTNDLIERYYAGERIRDLLDEYGLSVSPSKLVSLFPPIVHSNSQCPYCVSMMLETQRRARGGGSYAKTSPVCPSCNHKMTDNCRCKGCREKLATSLAQQRLVQRATIKREYTECRPCPSLANISLQDTLYLLSAIAHSASEDLSSIDPLNEKPPRLAPTFDLRIQIIKHLNARGFIAIDVDSDVNAFVFNDDGTRTTAYYPTKVTWRLLPGLANDEKTGYIRQLRRMVSDGDWRLGHLRDAAGLWREVKKYECLEYYFHLLKQRGFDMPEVGEKTHTTFDELLDYYAPSQAFSLIWMSVRDTVDYIVKEDLPKYRAKTTFVGAIQRKADRFRAEGWKAHYARRDYDCPQTILASMLFDTILGIGDKGFNEMPLEI